MTNQTSNGVEKIYNKLVRDNVPEIIEADGGAPKIRALTGEEFIVELLNKLKEEAEEVVKAKADRQELIKEIGDVYEVIDAIIDNCGLNCIYMLF